ncbi:MAG: transporter substrate-binding domain-containing protein [Rhizobiaceae bacterium]|nr:transporter substrate-binding domain-containing protein [Rhizobiaceae bacterium]
MLNRLLVAGAMLLAFGAMTVNTQARSLDEIITSGTVRIGVNPNQPPSSSLGKTNEYEGFDIDIGNRIAEAIGVKVEFVPTESAQRVPFLVADRIDLSLGALTRNPERAKLIDYTVPLHTEATSVLTTDKLNITSWKELNDPKYTIVNQRGNNSVGFLKELLPNVNVLLVETTADVVRALAQGRADALVENIDFFLGTTKSYPDVKWKVLPEIIDVAYDGIGVQKGNDSLRLFLNVLLYNMHSSEFVNQTWEKWYGAPPVVKIVPNPYF